MASPSWVYDLGRTSTCQGGDPNLMFESTSFAISETLIDHQLLIGGLEHFVFFHILGRTSPTDFIFFEGVETINQMLFSLTS